MPSRRKIVASSCQDCSTHPTEHLRSVHAHPIALAPQSIRSRFAHSAQSFARSIRSPALRPFPLAHSLTPSHRDDDLWVGIIASSHPKVFCAGADLKAVSKGGQRLDTDRGGFAGLVSRPLIKPLIAAVDGFALAGG